MARRRSRSRREVISKSAMGGDDFFDTSVTVKGAGFFLFSRAGQRQLRRTGVDAAADYFVDGLLPLRFTDYVRRSPWNYRGGRTDKNKDPLFTTGMLKHTVIQSARRWRTRATYKGAVAEIRISVTSYAKYRKNILRVLDTVSQREADQLAFTCVQAMIAQANESTTTRGGRRRLING